MIAHLTALAALALWAAPLGAQIGLTSAQPVVALSAVKRASVSVSLRGGGSVTLPGALVTGPNDFTPIRVTSAWDLDPAQTASMQLVGYFDHPTRALAGPDASISAAVVRGRVPTGGPKRFAPFTRAAPTGGHATPGPAGGTLVLFTQTISGPDAVGGRSDDLQVRLDLTDAPELPAGGYAGTLHLLVITQ